MSWEVDIKVGVRAGLLVEISRSSEDLQEGEILYSHASR